jgi:hypothetical protein
LHRQCGQALVLGIFFLLAGLAGTYFLFNTGQVITEKSRLVTAADAVAYGAGVMQARALNFDAYGNRALVANEVLIAQMVSLSSWSQYVKTHAENLPWQFPECTDPNGVGAGVGAIFKYSVYFGAMCYFSVQYAGEFIAGAAQQLPTLMQKIVTGVEANKKLIQLAQKALHGPADGDGNAPLSAFQISRAAVMQKLRMPIIGATATSPLPRNCRPMAGPNLRVDMRVMNVVGLQKWPRSLPIATPSSNNATGLPKPSLQTHGHGPVF